MSLIRDLLEIMGIDEKKLKEWQRQRMEEARPAHEKYRKVMHSLTDAAAKEETEDHDTLPLSVQFQGVLKGGRLVHYPDKVLALLAVTLAELTVLKRQGIVPILNVEGHDCGCKNHLIGDDCNDGGCGPFATCQEPRRNDAEQS